MCVLVLKTEITIGKLAKFRPTISGNVNLITVIVAFFYQYVCNGCSDGVVNSYLKGSGDVAAGSNKIYVDDSLNADDYSGGFKGASSSVMFYC